MTINDWRYRHQLTRFLACQGSIEAIPGVNATRFVWHGETTSTLWGVHHEMYVKLDLAPGADAQAATSQAREILGHRIAVRATFQHANVPATPEAPGISL